MNSYRKILKKDIRVGNTIYKTNEFKKKKKGVYIQRNHIRFLKCIIIATKPISQIYETKLIKHKNFDIMVKNLEYDYKYEYFLKSFLKTYFIKNK